MSSKITSSIAKWHHIYPFQQVLLFIRYSEGPILRTNAENEIQVECIHVRKSGWQTNYA